MLWQQDNSKEVSGNLGGIKLFIPDLSGICAPCITPAIGDISLSPAPLSKCNLFLVADPPCLK